MQAPGQLSWSLFFLVFQNPIFCSVFILSHVLFLCVCQDDDEDEKDKGETAADGSAKTKKKKKKKKKAAEEGGAAGQVRVQKWM